MTLGCVNRAKQQERAKGWDSSNLEPNSEHVVQLMIINAFYLKVLILLLAALAFTASTVSTTVGAHDTDASKLMSYKTGEAPRHVLSKRSPIPLGLIALPLRPSIWLGKLLAKPGLKLAKFGAVIG